MGNIYQNPLFYGLTQQETEGLLTGRIHINRYAAGEVVALQGDCYKSLLLIDHGAVRGEMTNQSGDKVVIEEIAAPRAIAPAFLYATDHVLPVDVIAVTDTVIAAIGVKDFTEILQSDSRVLVNFMRSMSDRSKFLSDRVRLLRFGTIKSKLAGYLSEQMDVANSTSFDIPHTHQALADMFGVTRPALSRALGQLTGEGIIATYRNHITVLNRDGIVRLLRHKA